MERVSVLVLAVRKKLRRKPMQALLRRLHAHPGLHVHELDEAGMACPVADWPHASVVVPLVSGTFPLEKTQEYAALRRAFVVNDLPLAAVLRDRLATRRLLLRSGVPIAPALELRRSHGDVARLRGDELAVFRKDGSLRGVAHKPFVEKPVDSEDHNVSIYYRGGGVRRLFRKVNNCSSALDEGETAVRNEGDFIYERFYEPQGGKDVKVYMAGDYCFAETRKAPHVDGLVERDDRGIEVRSETRLTDAEVATCHRVSEACGQFLNGFDFLRTKTGASYVIDVNGWSFVKRETKFSENLANKLITLLLEQISAVTPVVYGSSESMYRATSTAPSCEIGN